MRDLLETIQSALYSRAEPQEQPELRLQAMSQQLGTELTPRLMDAIDRACGWVLFRRMVSACALHFCLETQGRSLMDVYAALIEEGLELNHSSHRLLAEHCSLVHLHRSAHGRIFTLHLEVGLSAEAQSADTWRHGSRA